MNNKYKIDDIISTYRGEMAQISQSLMDCLNSENPLLVKSFETLNGPLSKKIRPLVSLLCADLVGLKNSDHRIILAVICEYIHMASLLHDDVVDEAQIRRGKESCQALYGNSAAILTGDYIYARACELIARTGSIGVLQLFASAIRLMSDGELMQLEMARTRDSGTELPPVITFDSFNSMLCYDTVIQRKTGALLAAASLAPYELLHSHSKSVRCPKKAEALYNLGLYLGKAYQVVDDILDYTSESSGKPCWQDFKEGKLTLPLYYVYQSLSDKERSTFTEFFFDSEKRLNEKSWFKEQIDLHKVIDRCHSYAHEITQDALSQLGVFERSQATKDLMHLGSHLLGRLS